MKIVKQGEIPEISETYTGWCYRCNCQVEAYYHETLLHVFGQNSLRYIWCPTYGCSERIILQLKYTETKDSSADNKFLTRINYVE